METVCIHILLYLAMTITYVRLLPHSGLEELQDRVTVGAGWGHAALSARLLACRRLLDRHHALRSALDSAKTRRATLRLAVENFNEGLSVVFSEGLDGLGVRGISELTRIRDLEGHVLTVREELDEIHHQWYACLIV